MTGRQDGTVLLEGVVVSQHRERVHHRSVWGIALGVLFQAPHETAVAIRTLLSYRSGIKGREFIKRVSELGAARAVPVRVEAKRGKGSHITLYYGPRKTVVKDLRKEVAPGLLSAMIRQLGLTRRDLR